MTVTTRLSLDDVARLRHAMLHLARRMRRRSGAGLTPSQLSALSTLERHGALRLGELADREQITKSSGTGLVGRLEALNLVQRRPDSTDGRSWRIELTDHGRDFLTESSQRANEYLARQVQALSADDQRRLLDALPVLDRLLEVKA